MYHGQVCLVKLCDGNTGVDECSTVEVPMWFVSLTKCCGKLSSVACRNY